MLCSILGIKWRPRYCFLLMGLYSEEKLKKETDKTCLYKSWKSVRKATGADAEREERGGARAAVAGPGVRRGPAAGPGLRAASRRAAGVHAQRAALPVFTGK